MRIAAVLGAFALPVTRMTRMFLLGIKIADGMPSGADRMRVSEVAS